MPSFRLSPAQSRIVMQSQAARLAASFGFPPVPIASAENAAINVTESDVKDVLVPTSENAAINVTESDAIDASVASAENAAVNVTETDSILADVASAENAAINVTESLDVQVIGDFPSLGLRAEVWDVTGATHYGGGIVNILSAEYGARLDEIGDWSMTIPAADEKAVLLSHGRAVWLYREGEGLVYRGVIDRDELEDTDEGAVLVVGGSSLARTLVWDNTLIGRSFANVTLASAVATLIASQVAGNFTAGTIGTPATNLGSLDFRGASLWEALAALARNFGYHLREDVLGVQVDVAPFGESSGIVLGGLGSVSPLLAESDVFYPITRIKRIGESGEVYNRLIPLGAGDGVNQLTLKWSNRASPYTIQNAVGPDGELYYFIENAASVTTYRRRTKYVQDSKLAPLANSLSAFRNAANALYDAAAAELDRICNPQQSYEVDVAAMKHLDTNGVPRFELGEKLRTIYSGWAEDADGTTRAFLDVDAELYLMGYRRSFNEDGSDSWTLTVSTIDRLVADAQTQIAGMFQEIRASQVYIKPYTFREIHGPERRSIDSTHPVTFIVDFDANCALLHDAKLSVALKPVRVNATGVASGGGATQTSTSGGGSTPTTAGGSSHSHTVSGGTAASAGTHRHLTALGPGSASSGGFSSGAGSGHNHASATTDGADGLVGVHAHTVSGGSGTESSHTHNVNPGNYATYFYYNGGTQAVTHYGVNGSDFYDYSVAADHTHTLSGITNTSESSHTHTVTISAHSHDVTIPSHSHSLSFGIFEGSAASNPNVSVTINGVDRTVALGGPFDVDFLAKEITTYLMDSDGQPLRQRNTIVFTSDELLDLEIVCKSVVSASTIIPV